MRRWFRFIRKGHLMILGASRRLDTLDRKVLALNNHNEELRRRLDEQETATEEMRKFFSDAINAVNADKKPEKPGPVRVRTMNQFRAAVGDGTAPQEGEFDVPQR